MTSASPFKLLDAYGKQDKDIFFGREEEVERLYEMVFQTNLSLVYGPSGSGKTSLINCGLANRFQPTDWFDIYIRRGDGVNAALLRSLRQYDLQPPDKSVLKEWLTRKRPNKPADAVTDEAPPPANEAIRTLREIYKQFLKPVYLIFDQFEELFILGTPSERMTFYQTISDILESEGYCRVILVLREEYLANLDEFEKIVPHLFEKRLRVEPMSRQQTSQVIVGTTNKFEIGLKEESTPDAIIDALTKDQQRVELTYLQVFLDKLYRRAARRSEGEKVVFDNRLVTQLGDIEDVLGEFLDTQSAEIQGRLREEYPDAPSQVIDRILNAFVTLEGTKQPLDPSQVKVPGLRQPAVEFCLDQLEKARLLRREEGQFELAHDALAQRIAARRTAEEVALLQVAKIVRDRHQAFSTTNTYLNHNELQLLESFRESLRAEERLSREEWAFVRKSIRENNRRRRWRVGMVLAAMLVLAAFAIIFFNQRNYARDQTEIAEAALLKAQEEEKAKNEANYDKFLTIGKNAVQNSEYAQAIPALEAALEFDKEGPEATELLTEARRQLPNEQKFNRLLSDADSLFIEDDYFAARDLYQEALALGFNDDLVERKQSKVREKLAGEFEKLKQAGESAFDAGEEAGNINVRRRSYEYALRAYESARRIEENADLLERIRLCREKIETLDQ